MAEAPSPTRTQPAAPQRDTSTRTSQALDLPTFGPLGLGGLALGATIAATAGSPPNPAEKR